MESMRVHSPIWRAKIKLRMARESLRRSRVRFAHAAGKKNPPRMLHEVAHVSNVCRHKILTAKVWYLSQKIASRWHTFTVKYAWYVLSMLDAPWYEYWYRRSSWVISPTRLPALLPRQLFLNIREQLMRWFYNGTKLRRFRYQKTMFVKLRWFI